MTKRLVLGSLATLLAVGCGTTPPATVTRIDAEPAGANCADGGSAVRLGADDNGNGALDDAEVDSVQYICSAAATPALVRLAEEPAGDHCAHGGQAVLSGLDRNHDGALGDDEVTSTMYVCRDAVAAPITRFDPEPSGTHCKTGGTAVKTGLDSDGNGTLDAAEVATVQYVCRDAELTRTDVEPAGAHCTAGGAAVKSGLDRNGDGTLGDDEILDTEYVCGSVIAGNYDAYSQDEIVALQGIQAVTGNLTIHYANPITAVDLPDLRVVGGDLDIVYLQNATRVQAPVLRAVGGTLDLSDLPKVTTLSLPSLVSARELRISNTAATSVSLPALTTVDQSFRIDTSPVAQLDLSALQTAGALDLWNLQVAAVAVPRLYWLGELDLVDSTTTSLSAPDLDFVNGPIRIGRDASMATIDLPSLQGAQGDITFRDMPALRALALPTLDTVGGHVQVFDNVGLTSLSMPKVVTIPGWLLLTGDTALATLDLGKLWEIHSGFYFESNQAMRDLSQLTALTSIGGETTIGATQLQHLAIPNLMTVDIMSIGRADTAPLLDNPVLTTVDLPRLRDAMSVIVSEGPHVTAIQTPELQSVWGLAEFWDLPAMKKCTIDPWLASLKVAPPEVHLVHVDETSTCP